MEDGSCKMQGRQDGINILLNWYHDLVYLAYMVLNINVKLLTFTTSTSHVLTRSATAVAHNQQR